MYGIDCLAGLGRRSLPVAAEFCQRPASFLIHEARLSRLKERFSPGALNTAGKMNSRVLQDSAVRIPNQDSVRTTAII